MTAKTGCEAPDLLVLVIYFMCWHMKKGGLVELAAILEAISTMSGA